MTSLARLAHFGRGNVLPNLAHTTLAKGKLAVRVNRMRGRANGQSHRMKFCNDSCDGPDFSCLL
jgi:hypothetical protein